ncbi:hypothetical protein [Vibrio sp. THAF190c]|jgi:hypothetical protein|uniref:hypothetical protein n=1 Tax=Vibrio sp. THAF190c TaxID=2587865 RepID=UPI001267BEC6|nr:hypothetical protein [Vibrio sp. THAF190c]QFT13376.1 hypothetical protein FIV04_25835 [Vibrio sp. THAF190c]
MKKLLTLCAAISAITLSANANAVVTSANDKAQLNLFFGASNLSKNAASIIPPMPRLTLMSAKVVAPTSCKGNFGLAISNAFTDGTLQKIYDNFDAVLRQLASREGLIYLSSLYVSKSNPALWQLIQEGIDVTVTDFLSGIASCEAMANSIIENVADDTVIEMQRQSTLNQIIEANAQTALDQEWNHIDVDDVFKKGAEAAAEAGFSIFGSQRGGDSQPALDIVTDTLSIGWCVYRGFTKNECIAFRNSDISKLADSDKSDSKVLLNVPAFNQAAEMLLGNSHVSICNGCSTINTSAKESKHYLLQVQKVFEARIKQLSLKQISQITEDEYKSVSINNSIVADANYFRNLAVLNQDLELKADYISGWAFDMAYFETLTVLTMLESSIIAAMNTDDVAKSGLTAHYDRQLMQVEFRRRELKEFTDKNNYTPRMYVSALLQVTDRVSKGLSPLGKFGNDL